MGCLERGTTRYKPAVIAEARKLWAEGVKAREIARRLGISGAIIVRRWCDEAYRAENNRIAREKHRTGLMTKGSFK